MEKPLFVTEAEAFAAEGEIYEHYKGGVYRLVLRGVLHCDTHEPGVLYEHLWPYDYAFWWRQNQISSASPPITHRVSSSSSVVAPVTLTLSYS